MINQNEDKCIYCQAFDYFQEMLMQGFNMKESFHTVVESLVDEVSEDSFEEGLTTGMKFINNVIHNAIENIEQACDCESCTGECDEVN